MGHGIRSTLSLPLVVDDRAIGALNMYAETTDAFTDDHRRAAQLFVIQACSLLAYAQARDDARTLADDLSAAMASRGTIEQAKGILMATNRCSLDQAFDILVRASQRENRKLRDIAAALVERYDGTASEDRASRGAPDQRFA